MKQKQTNIGKIIAGVLLIILGIPLVPVLIGILMIVWGFIWLMNSQETVTTEVDKELRKAEIKQAEAEIMAMSYRTGEKIREGIEARKARKAAKKGPRVGDIVNGHQLEFVAGEYRWTPIEN